MNNYIKSEFYRMLRNKWTYLFILICSALLISSNVVLAAVKCAQSTFGYATTSFSIGNFVSSMSFVFILCISVSYMIFSNEYSNHTMKNSVSYGVSRGTIYFGKLIVEIVYSLVSFIIITAVHVASAYLLLENSHINEFRLLAETLVACLPIFLFVLAASNCFAFILESSGSSIGANVGLLIALPLVCSLLGMKFKLFHDLAKVLPWNIIQNINVHLNSTDLILPWKGNEGYYICWMAGMIQMVLIMLVGYVIYRRKEVK